MSVAPETGRNRIMMALTSWSSRQPMARHWRSAFGAQLRLPDLAATLGDDDLRTMRPCYFRALASYCTTAFGAVGS
jgi:hypothetical protein